MPTPSVFSNGANGTAVPVDPRLRAETLYSDPSTAMLSILRGMGYNPFKNNPFVQKMMQAAPGLQSAWQLSNIGANVNDLDANGGPDQMFGNFLQNQLQNGSVFSTLANARQNMGNYTNQLSSLQQKLNDPNGGVDVNQLPAFLEALTNRLDNPNEWAKLFGSLAAPGLGSMARPFQNTLNAASNNAYIDRANAPSFGQPTAPDFFEWIMGKR